MESQEPICRSRSSYTGVIVPSLRKLWGSASVSTDLSSLATTPGAPSRTDIEEHVAVAGYGSYEFLD